MDPTLPPPTEDGKVGMAYTQYRSEAPGAAALSSLLSDVNSQQTQPNAGAGAAPAAPGASPAQVPGATPAPAPMQPQDFGPVVSAPHQQPIYNNAQQDIWDTTQKGFVPDPNYRPNNQHLSDVPGALYHDVLPGLTLEAPTAIKVGVRNSLQSWYDAFDDAAQKLTGDYSKDSWREWVDKKTLADPKTETGKMLSGVVQFVTSVASVNRVIGGIIPKAMQLGTAGTALFHTAKNAAATFMGFDPAAGRLSDLVEQHPELSNPVTRALQTDPSDSAAWGRLKNVFDQFLPQTLIDPFLAGLRTLGAAERVKAAAETIPPEAGAQGSGGPIASPAPPTLPPNAFSQLGDEHAHGPLLRQTQTAAEPSLGVPKDEQANFGHPAKPETLPAEHPLLQPKDQDKSPELVQERQALIAERFEGKQPAPADRKPVAIIMGGGGASGKGTIVKQLEKAGEIPENAVHLDPDSFKSGDEDWGFHGLDQYKQIVQAGDWRAAKTVHEESSDLYKTARQQAIDGHYDLVLDRTLGGDQAKVAAELKSLRDAGYDVKVYGVTVPIRDAVERAFSRAERSGRHVPIGGEDDALITAHKNFSANFESTVNHPEHEVRLYDNGVPKDTEPKLIASSEKGQPDVAVHDREAYTAFEEKAHANPKATTFRDLQGGSAGDDLQSAGEADAQAAAGSRGGAGAADHESALAADRGPAGGSGQGLPGAAGASQPVSAERIAGLADFSALPPEQIPSSAAGREMVPPRTFINYARIDSADDVKRVMGEIADAREAKPDMARAGVQSFADVKLDAAHQDAWKILQDRRQGEPLPAGQMVAARGLWADATQKLVDAARQVAASPDEASLFAFKKMQEVHGWIQDQVLGARTAGARSLASWKIPVGPDEDRLIQLSNKIRDQAGGTDAIRDVARRVVALDESGQVAELNQFVAKSVGARTRDAVIQFFRDALLSSPVTQAHILASNVSTAIWALGERKLAEIYSSAFATPNGVAPGEAAAMWAGWTGGAKDALAFAWKAAKTGETGAGIGAPHEPMPSNLSGEALGLTEGSTMARAADLLGTAASWGFGFGGRRGIIAQHDMALTMGYSAELRAQATRQALSEINAGTLEQGQYANRVASLLQGPDGAPDELIAVPARAAAKYRAFLDEPGDDMIGKLTDSLLEARKNVPALNVIVPFIKIPSRIMSYTFERTPLAPLMSDWRTKVAAGGASRNLALAQTSLGSLVTMAAADMVFSGQLKGGGPPEKGLAQAQEREGMKRDSIKIGDSWYNINGVHPIGKLILLAADVAEAIHGGQHELKDDEDTTKLAVGTALAIARTLTNASYMQGLANFFATVHDAKVGGSGQSALLSIAGSTVPTAVAAVDRAGDPYQRAVYTMLDEFKSKIPGLSETLPPRRDFWGEPVSAGHDALTRLASPVQFQKETHSPIDDEILKQGFNLAMPGKNQSFGPPGNSVQMDLSKYPAAYSRYLELRGHAQELYQGSGGLKDKLNAIVSGTDPLSPTYRMMSDGPGGMKQKVLEKVISEYSDAAKARITGMDGKPAEFPELSNDINAKGRQMRTLKMGALAQ